MVEDGSESDGYLSEDSSCLYASVSKTELQSEDAGKGSELSIQNQTILSELLAKKKRLEALKQKDPHFVIFLQEKIKGLESLDNDNMSDEDEASNHDLQSFNGVAPSPNAGKVLSSSTLKSWCQLVKEQQNLSILRGLLNAYRSACHYGAESTESNTSVSSPVIQNKETFCTILMFMLSESDQLFRVFLGISSDCKKQTILELKSSSKWESVKPMVKSFLTSTLSLLNQFTDADMLAYSLKRLRVSLVAVHLWATGGGNLSSCSFNVLRDLASHFGHDSYDKCLKKTYKAIISRCKVVDPSNLNHIEYIINSFVELCSIDLQKSIKVALASAQKLAVILSWACKLRRYMEALKKICSWEYVLCIDLWVKYVSVNFKDCDLHGLLYPLIQVINGVAKLFAGPKYLPLRVKCIHWLNQLSTASEIFIPVSSLALDLLESSNAQGDEKRRKGSINLSTILMWSHHISFPELATVPIIRLKQFYEKSATESLRRPVKRLIDQVEKNMEFVQRKREDVSFSPIDQGSADSFLQSEKRDDKSPFIQYYKSIMLNAMTRKLSTKDHTNVANQNNSKEKKQKPPQKSEDVSVDGVKRNCKDR
uniref:Nucleolar complex protein 2 homolog n=1 Tax=Chenopodium quinoa TaxID=63459 RepID=A0A803NDE6_CHEQI